MSEMGGNINHAGNEAKTTLLKVSRLNGIGKGHEVLNPVSYIMLLLLLMMMINCAHEFLDLRFSQRCS